MDEASYGLIVEGYYDELVFPEFVRKILSKQVAVVVRKCGGVPGLMKLFPSLLRDLEQVRAGKPVDKAMVIRDWPGPDIATCEEEMASKIRGEQFNFRRGVQFCGVRQAMEAWLLADQNAINSVSRTRGGRTVERLQGQIEEMVNPKQRLTRLLSDARLPYTAEVGREIASQADLETLKYRCPSFRSFVTKVIDC